MTKTNMIKLLKSNKEVVETGLEKMKKEEVEKIYNKYFSDEQEQEEKEEVKNTGVTLDEQEQEQEQETRKGLENNGVIYPSFNETDNIINVVQYDYKFKDKAVSPVFFTTLAPKENIVKVTNKEMFANMIQLHILDIQKVDILNSIAKLSKAIEEINNNGELTEEEKEEQTETLKEEKDFLEKVNSIIKGFISSYVTVYETKDDISLLIACAVMNKNVALLPLLEVNNVKNLFNNRIEKLVTLEEVGKVELTEEEKEMMSTFRKAMLENSGIGEKASFNITKETECTSSMKLVISNRDGIECIISLFKGDSKGKRATIANSKGKKANETIQKAVNNFMTQRLYSRICGETK